MTPSAPRTVRKTAPPAQHVLEPLLDALDDAAIVVSRTGEVRAANAAGRELARRMPGCVTDALVGNHDGLEAHALRDPSLVLLVARSEKRPIDLVADRARGDWRLTSREMDVLRCLLRGLGNKELADALGCTKRTVETHVTSVLEKSGCASRLELVAMCWSQWAEASWRRG